MDVYGRKAYEFRENSIVASIPYDRLDTAWISSKKLAIEDEKRILKAKSWLLEMKRQVLSIKKWLSKKYMSYAKSRITTDLLWRLF